MSKKNSDKLNPQKPSGQLFGYRAFINQDKVKFDAPIDIGDDIIDIQSVAASSEIPEIKSPSLAPSIRATSPVPSIISSTTSKKSAVIKNKPPEQPTSFDIPVISSRMSDVSRKSHRSRRSHREPSPTRSEPQRNSSPPRSVKRSSSPANSTHSLPPIYEENTEAQRLLQFQLERRRQKLYNEAMRIQQKYSVRFTRRITPDMPIKDLEEELKLAKRNRKIERDVGFAKSTLIWVTKAIEWAAKQSDVIDLEGWNDEIRRDLPEIGEIFEEIYEEHEDVINKLSDPWTKLGMIWAGGAVKIATTNYMTKFAGQQWAKKKKTKSSEVSDDEGSDGELDPANDPELDELMREANAI
jgi:hypothetical protein